MDFIFDNHPGTLSLSNGNIKSSVADPRSGAFFGSWIRDPGWLKNPRSGSGIRDENPESHFRELRNKFCFVMYLNSLMRMRIRDPGIFSTLDPEWVKIRIRDKHLGSATPTKIQLKTFNAYNIALLPNEH